MARQAVDILVERLGGRTPTLAVILGSGLGELADRLSDPIAIPYADLPGFPRTTVSGHSGRVVCGGFAGRTIVALSGRAHFYEKGDAAVMDPVIAALAGFGVTTLLLTNAAGSVRKEMGPGSVMIVEDHIALGPNPLVGRGEDGFVNMVDAYEPAIREALGRAAEAAGEPIHRGTYCWFTGPSFETPAEIRMARTLGADAVGMSTVPEVILARFHGLSCGALSMITNLGAGMVAGGPSHAETKSEAAKGSRRLIAILEKAVETLA